MTEKLKIRQATKQGYDFCKIGGVFNASYPSSKTRRARVIESGNICPTILCEETMILRIEYAGKETGKH